MTDTQDHQSVSVVGFGKRIGFTGPNAFPWFVILLLLSAVGSLVFFSLGKWGEPIDLKATIADHTMRMSYQHQAVWEAVDRNTYVQWACSPNNTSPEARRECTGANPMRPESMDHHSRQYGIPKDLATPKE